MKFGFGNGDEELNYFEIQKLYKEYENYLKYNCAYTKLGYDAFMNNVPINTEVGYIDLYITKDLGREFSHRCCCNNLCKTRS